MYSLLLAIIYLAFISLGLPDALLGSAWPSMYVQFGVPVSYAGAISMIIAVGTVVSALMSDALTRRLGTGRVTAISVLLTAAALFGFSISSSFWMLCLWAVPYGIGAGCVDAALNNFVALHYASRHMSWLHCMWGIGASVGPYVMGYALSGGHGWPAGYRYIAVIQAALTVILLLSLPMWKRGVQAAQDGEEQGERPGFRALIRTPGAKSIMLAFFCYSAIENTSGLWASSFLVLHHGISEELAARFASLFYIGITAGRALCGFITAKLSDTSMIRLGQGVLLLGAALLIVPVDEAALAGLVLIGLGCAPIYPSIIHSTPEHFGASRSQAMIGLEMASAYTGTTLMPPLFGLIANHIDVGLLPCFLLVFWLIMLLAHERVVKACKR
ncbi:MAG TPA: MFS transporter [Candidatus Scatomorpha gallistercoris]|nr:MFS transporter [Candidatus Scatomorpha gallistercoris]